MKFSPFCLSSYLAFRYVAKPGVAWCPGVEPSFPMIREGDQRPVSTSAQIEDALGELLAPVQDRKDVGLLLSGGIDSAILAALLPAGTRVYTIRFEAPGAVDESVWARRYADACGLRHRTVTVSWPDYLAVTDALMLRKKAPLHAVEVGLMLATQQAVADGVSALVIGNGADSTFGGLDQLLSREWSFDDFVRRYTFLRPEQFLVDPVDLTDIYTPYRLGDGIDVLKFLKVVHGLGILQAFDNAIQAGGCSTIEPFEHLRLEGPLDLHRIRNGESKYLLRELFTRLYPNLPTPEKIPFARPMNHWLRDWHGPLRREFRTDISFNNLTGDQKWLLWCLNRFLDLVEAQAR